MVIDRIKERLGMQEKLAVAIDVGCGNGLSTVPLGSIAERVFGIDPSQALLDLAIQASDVTYIFGRAEELPFPDDFAGIVTVSTAFHWFERNRFLGETFRVLQPGGWLVIYGNQFYADMVEDPRFAAWMNENYGRLFPTPPKPSEKEPPFDAEQAKRYGFTFVTQENYQNNVPFSLGALINYLTTHSNIIARVEVEGEPIDEVRKHLHDELRHLFENRKEGTFRFGGAIRYYQSDKEDGTLEV